VGVAGVNWTSPLLHVRVLGACRGFSADIIDGMRWAAGLAVPGVPANAYPARVLNLSLGGQSRCPSSWQSVINDVTARGAVVVVAAGNANQDAANFTPAGCNGVITVAATDRDGSRAWFSNFGAAVEISAPGVNVISTLNDGTTRPGAATYNSMSGTSMAAPHVSGVVSLMLSRNSSLTPAQVLASLQQTARRFPSGSTCTTSLCGSGIVDAAAAVAAVSPKKFQFAIGAQATVGQFGGPASVAVAPDGTVYVADSGNHRIQRFSASGTLPQRVGVIGQRRRTVQLS